MDATFFASLREKAKARRARIGIGIQHADASLISGLLAAREYADLVLVGRPCCGSSLDCIPAEEPWRVLVDLLSRGEIDGAVRGNLSSSKTMRALAKQFDVQVRRLALMELSGWAFLLGPVGIDEGESISEKLCLVMDGAKYLHHLGVSPKVAILSGGRLDDIGRSERVDRSLAEAEFVAARAREAGVMAKHKGILLESCRGDDLILAPEGVSGNLIFRTLLFLCGASSLGAPVLMDAVFIDTSRARDDFKGPVMLASAMVGMRDRQKKQLL